MAAKKTEASGLEVTMVHDKDTKNTHLYREEKPGSGIKSLYIDKGSVNLPERITVTVRPA